MYEASGLSSRCTPFCMEAIIEFDFGLSRFSKSFMVDTIFDIFHGICAVASLLFVDTSPFPYPPPLSPPVQSSYPSSLLTTLPPSLTTPSPSPPHTPPPPSHSPPRPHSHSSPTPQHPCPSHPYPLPFQTPHLPRKYPYLVDPVL